MKRCIRGAVLAGVVAVLCGCSATPEERPVHPAILAPEPRVFDTTGMTLAALIAAGQAAYRELDLEKALYLFEKATELDPDNLELQRRLDSTRLTIEWERKHWRELITDMGGGRIEYRKLHAFRDRCRVHLHNALTLADRAEFELASLEIVAAMPSEDERRFRPSGWTNWIRWQEAGYRSILKGDPGAASFCFEFALEFSLEQSQYLRPTRHAALRRLAAVGSKSRPLLCSRLCNGLPRERFADKLIAFARAALFVEEGTDFAFEALDRAVQLEPGNRDFRGLRDAARRFARMQEVRR